MVDLPLASRGQVAARIFNDKIGPNVLTTYDEFKAHVLHDFPDKRFEITIYRIYSLLRINGNKRKGDYCMGTDLKKNLLQFDAKFKLVNDGEAHTKDRLSWYYAMTDAPFRLIDGKIAISDGKIVMEDGSLLDYQQSIRKPPLILFFHFSECANIHKRKNRSKGKSVDQFGKRRSR